jgi:membrane protease YdiL (CAAX protease family)
MSRRDGQRRGGDDGHDHARTAVHGLVAFGLTVLGVVASAVGGVPGLLLGPDTPVGFVVGAVGGELGFLAVGLGFLVVTGRGIGYLDLRLPGSAREWGLVVGVVLGLFVVRMVLLVGALELGVEPAPSAVSEVDLPTPVLAAILVPLMLLVVGPVEELLFRGVIQKFLRETTGPWPAILGAGLLFGSIHVFSIVISTSLGAVVSLVVITGVGICLGWLYERTGSLPAAMVGHGAYNALIVASAYALEVLL